MEISDNDKYVYLVVWDFSPRWLDEFFRYCDKKAVKGTFVDDLFSDWHIKNFEESNGYEGSDGYYGDLAYIRRGKVRDALAISREVFDEIISELKLENYFGKPCEWRDCGKVITRIAKNYILSLDWKQSFLMRFGDNSTDNLFLVFIGEDFIPIVRGCALALSSENLEGLCHTTYLQSVKDVAFGRRKTRVGFLNKIRDRIKHGSVSGGDSVTSKHPPVKRYSLIAQAPPLYSVEQSENTPQTAERAGGEDVRAHYQQTAKAWILKTVKPLLKHIKDKDYFKTARELRITNISATKKQNGLRFDGDEVSFTDADGVTYGYFIGGSCKVESGCCWVQMAPGQTNYILNEAKYKDFYNRLKQIAQNVKELS